MKTEQIEKRLNEFAAVPFESWPADLRLCAVSANASGLVNSGLIARGRGKSGGKIHFRRTWETETNRHGFAVAKPGGASRFVILP